MRQFRTATPDLSYRIKADIIDLQNWIEFQSRTIPTAYRLSFCGDRYNYNELLDNPKSQVKLYFSYHSRLDNCDLTITLDNYEKVVEILAVIKSKQFNNEDIYRKILLKFTK